MIQGKEKFVFKIFFFALAKIIFRVNRLPQFDLQKNNREFTGVK